MASALQLKQFLMERKVRETINKEFEEAGKSVKERVNTFLRRRYAFRELFEDLVIGRLPKPAITTADDLADAFESQILLQASDSFDNCYQNFLLCALASTFSERSSAPFPCLEYISSPHFDLGQFSPLEEEILLWETKEEFKLCLNGVLDAQLPFSETISLDQHIAYATVIGHCTERALRKAVAEIKTILPSVFQTFYLLAELQHKDEMARLFDELLKITRDDSPSPPNDGNGSSNAKTRPPANDDVEPSKADTSSLSTDTENEGHYELQVVLRMLHDLIDAYFSPPSKKDSTANRIRNAVHFLAKADQQAETSIGLVLSVTAMEALVCDGTGNVTDTFAENIANLLEPQLSERLIATHYLSRLYNQRSRIVHGSQIEADKKSIKDARVIAAAVLQAYVNRREYVSRLAAHDYEKPAELFSKLKNHRHTEGPFQGVMTSMVPEIWRSQQIG